MEIMLYHFNTIPGAKISQQDYIKLRNFCTAKESINKMIGSLQNGRK